MKQKDEKNLRENISPADVYAKDFPNHAANELFAKVKVSIQENDTPKKAEELLAPYYDEFHFANYE